MTIIKWHSATKFLQYLVKCSVSLTELLEAIIYTKLTVKLLIPLLLKYNRYTSELQTADSRV